MGTGKGQTMSADVSGADTSLSQERARLSLLRNLRKMTTDDWIYFATILAILLMFLGTYAVIVGDCVWN